MLKEKQTSKNISINQETKNNSKKIKKTAAKVNVTKETQTLPQESSNDLKINLDLEADKLIAEANKVPEADIDLDDDDDNASVLSSAQEAAAKALAMSPENFIPPSDMILTFLLLNFSLTFNIALS